MKYLFSAFCLLLAYGAYGAEYYVDIDSRGGPCDDSGPGTLERPWRTLNRAVSGQEPRPEPGDTVWIREGVYREEMAIQIGGTEKLPLTIKAFPDEKPIIDGDGKLRNGIILRREGNADYVVIEGLTVKNIKSEGIGIFVDKRVGVTIRTVEVSGARIGVWLNGCKESKLLESEVHHCQGGNVLVDTGCSDIVLADNHVHHSISGHNLSIYAPGDGTRGQGTLISVEPHAPGLARFTTEKLELHKVRRGTLRGQNEAGSVKNPGLVLLFPKDPGTEGKPLPGGTVRLEDGRYWFVLRNNQEWNDKPYSPDGKTGLFEIGQADMDTLSRAKYAYVAYTFNGNAVVNKDIQILRNEVDHGAVQGIWVQRSHNVLIRGNKLHHNGATGIQIESLCRRIWIEENTSYANSIQHSHETGIWLDETIDAVVQNNIAYENQKGMGITQCEWVIMRRNLIYNNQGQHLTTNVEGGRRNAGAFWFSGGRHHHLGAPPGAKHNAFVHNTLYDNGTEISSWGGIQHGISGYPSVSGNRFLNNLVQNTLGAHLVYMGTTPVVLNGNLYSGTGTAKVLWRQAGKQTIYNISNPEKLAKYQSDTGQDQHSLVADGSFIDANSKDFRLAEGSMAIDNGQPLTRTTSSGEGTDVQVEDVSCFSAGFKTSKGEVLIPGDEIMIAGSRARILAVNRKASVLTIDRGVNWEKGDAVTYLYEGSGPDVGAIEGQ
ncbi:right-handed parallel beta-helix repeat-containing protein [Candidatus Poribacteria bacterium]